METKYTADHEWLTADGDVVTVGITHFAQEQLGDLVYIELPKVGAKLGKGDMAGTVESGKAVSDVFAPIGGEVIEINAAIVAEPGKVNADPMGNWFFRLKTDGAADLSEFMDAAKYEEHTKQ
jgi:glycine cleavage system H protein